MVLFFKCKGISQIVSPITKKVTIVFRNFKFQFVTNTIR
jgi:hypothetical protein